MNLVYRPWEGAWPGDPTPPSQRHSRHAFKAGWSSTLTLLDAELRHLGARGEIVVQLDLPEWAFRIDGGLHSRAGEPTRPGVILSFESRLGAMRYACDRFDWWRHNVRAIALGLEALRKVDRYGIGTGREQYAGWLKLPAGGSSAEWARGWLRQHGYASVLDALKTLGPDMPAHDRALFAEAMQVRAILGTRAEPITAGGRVA